MILTIPNTPKVQRVVYTPPFSAVCSVGLAPFSGVIRIEFKPGDKLLEFESFEKWLREQSTQSVTIEDMARLVFDALENAIPGMAYLSVTVQANTIVHAPVEVTIERGEK